MNESWFSYQESLLYTEYLRTEKQLTIRIILRTYLIHRRFQDMAPPCYRCSVLSLNTHIVILSNHVRILTRSFKILRSYAGIWYYVSIDRSLSSVIFNKYRIMVGCEFHLVALATCRRSRHEIKFRMLYSDLCWCWLPTWNQLWWAAGVYEQSMEYSDWDGLKGLNLLHHISSYDN